MSITLDEVWARCVKDEYPILDKDLGLVYVLFSGKPGQDLLRRLYHVVSAEDELPVQVEEIVINYEAIAEKLVKGLDAKALIIESLRDAPPDVVLDIAMRVTEKPEAAVKSAPRCFALLVYGKRGAPAELVIRR